MNAGFACSITVKPEHGSKRIHFWRRRTLSAKEIGITTDFQLTTTLYHLLWQLTSSETFLNLNRSTVERCRTQWLKMVKNYRNHCRLEALQKHQTLSYNFYLNIYCRPHMAYHDLTSLLKQVDINPAIIDIPNYARSGMIYLFERMIIVNQSSVHQWW